MAMVEISNGDVAQIVSRGAYESQFKPLGFWIVGSRNNTIGKETQSKDMHGGLESSSIELNDSQLDDEFVDLLETPVTQWTNEQLKQFVLVKGIDTSSAKKTSEVKNIVKDYIDRMRQV